MAGGDEAGESFAARYDPAVKGLLELLGNGVGAFGGISKGLVATARNYAKAEHHSTVKAGEYIAAFADPPVFSAVSYGTPSTAAGGHIDGVNRFLAKFWPQGDPDKLRQAAAAFRTAESSLSALGQDAQGVVSDLLASNVAPALDSFETTWNKIWGYGGGSLGQATTTCTTLANACEQYASRIDTAHHDLEIAAGTVAFVTGAGVVLTIFSFGISDVAAAAIDAGVAEECGVIAAEFATEAAIEVEAAIEADIAVTLEAATAELPEIEVVEAEVEETVATWEEEAAEIESPAGETAGNEADIERLGRDPATGQIRQSEVETGQRIEQETGVRLERSPDAQGPDWVDPATGETYDAVGNFDAQYFDRQWPNLQDQIVSHLGKTDWVPVDVSKFSPSQVALVKQFISQYAPRVYIVGGGG